MDVHHNIKTMSLDNIKMIETEIENKEKQKILYKLNKDKQKEDNKPVDINYE